jgi:hypothetical protein
METLKREIKKLTALSLFFLIGFGYILLIMKLFLKEYSIDTYVLSKAIIGALIAAKSVMIMDATPLLNRFEGSAPRYISVLYKTAIYTLAGLFIGGIEHLWDAYHRTREITSAFESFVDSEHFYRFLAVSLCVSVVFLLHNIFTEMDSYLGRGSLKKIFFGQPKI